MARSYVPTSAQRRVLQAIDYCTAPDMPADGWGEVFSHFDAHGESDDNPAHYLVMRNFDASVKVCKANGWISVVEDDVGVAIALTDAGRAALDGKRGR